MSSLVARLGPILLLSLWSPSLGAAPGPQTVEEEIGLRRERVTEFRLVREAAQELGFRVWLFGGTAAGFAHYVRWDLAREGGDTRYRESFFDYDFTNIYRSTQDADLVVDATPEQAAQLEELIRERMSFLQGSKEHWEVRLLRYPRNVGTQVKVPLLGNPDFLEQNTDSNSTGMIELTDPPAGESVVRDLRDWESRVPFFLQDVTEGRLHYYLSPAHEQTSRFRDGNNPPLFSVIRYLVKAFQYDLQLDGEDLAKVQAIIDAFRPRRDYSRLSSWAKGWLERYGPNLIRHSVNIEYAWDTLERLGLREKLISLSDPSQEGSLGWWLSKEPLRTAPVGSGSGKTAAELGIDIVAHETGDFLAYESITRDTTLRPNVLISRPGHPGEAAQSGPGFYTLRGRSGARGTGLTIRFALDPAARKGTDFKVHGQVVRILNRAAITVIPESLDMPVVRYFELLQEGALRADPDDRGIWMKLRRRLQTRQLSPAEEDQLVAMVSQEIDQLAREGGWARLLPEWVSLPASHAHPEVEEKLRNALLAEIEQGNFYRETYQALLRAWFELPLSRTRPEVVERLIEKHATDTYLQQDRPIYAGDQLVKEILDLPGWSNQPGVIQVLLRQGMFVRVAACLTRPHWRDHPELVRELIERMPEDWAWRKMLFEVLDQAQWADHPELLVALAEGADRASLFAQRNVWDPSLDFLLRREFWKHSPPLRDLCGGDPTVGCIRRAAAGEAVRRAASLEHAIESIGGSGSGGCEPDGAASHGR